MKISAARGILLLILAFTVPATALGVVHEVMVMDNRFIPKSLSIQPGDTVRWINAPGGAPHNVTSDDDAWTPSGTSDEFEFEVVFDTPGEFPYTCTVHFGMDGTITVEGAVSEPELALTSVDAANGSYSPGNMLPIDFSIMNSGTAGSGAFTIDFYASTDNSITNSDELLGSMNVGDIAMGDTLNDQAMVNVPESIAAGDYFIGAIIQFSDGNDSDNSNHDATVVTFLGLFFINAGLNDAWVSDDAPFQGFFFTVFPDFGFFFISWFTFDSVVPVGPDSAVFGAFDQRWVTGGGFFLGDSVTINVELTTGGIFNDDDPAATQVPNYGTITIVFTNCNEAILTYNFPSLGLSGQMTLKRVLEDNVPLCVALNAELQANPP